MMKMKENISETFQMEKKKAEEERELAKTRNMSNDELNYQLSR